MDNPQDKDKNRKHLVAALDHILAVLVTEGHLPLTPPVEALDAALGADVTYQEARAEVRVALEVLHGAAKEHGLERLVLAYEAAANHMVVLAVEVGWRVCVTATRAGRA